MGPVLKVEILTPELSIESRIFSPCSIELVDVFQVVGSRKTQEGYNKLKRNVEAEGFKSPIIVIPNTKENYSLAIRHVESSFVRSWQELKPYLCMYGNQRIEIALELGIFELSSILTPTVEWAHATHLKLIP